MAQVLITEGNDAISLASLCRKCGLMPPLGYENKVKFREDFVKIAGGYEKAMKTFEIELGNPLNSNIGLVIDADEAGAENRWQKIRNILSELHFEPNSLEKADAQKGPKIINETNQPVVGIWIMPNNKDNGYLEHFFAKLIPDTKRNLWEIATLTIDNLLDQRVIDISEAKIGKSQLHTWLAWQREPGKPFGQAIEANYFDLNAPIVRDFIDWFSNTYELSSAK